jgi:hypothetical protein
MNSLLSVRLMAHRKKSATSGIDCMQLIVY